jgi:dTDP-4-dehydrorhamnose reductase
MDTTDKKIIVTGGEGMVGSQTPFGIRLGHGELDVADPDSINNAIAKYRPDIILHLAAIIDMPLCEKYPELGYLVNTVGTYNLASACRENGIKLIYISTATVFDGDKTAPYVATDIPNPLHVYGRTKWLGEIIVRDLVPNFLIVRAGWLFGGGWEVDNKFAINMLRKLLAGENIEAVSDRFGSLTFVPDFIEELKNLINRGASGTFHLANGPVASYFEIAQIIARAGSFKSQIIKTDSSKFDPSVRRGAMEGIVSSVPMREWREPLEDYIIQLMEKQLAAAK